MLTAAGFSIHFQFSNLFYARARWKRLFIEAYISEVMAIYMFLLYAIEIYIKSSKLKQIMYKVI